MNSSIDNSEQIVRTNAIVGFPEHNFQEELDSSTSSSDNSSTDSSSSSSSSSVSRSVSVQQDDDDSSSEISGQENIVSFPSPFMVLVSVVAILAVVEYPKIPIHATVLSTLMLLYSNRYNIIYHKRKAMGVTLYIICAIGWFATIWRTHALTITSPEGQAIASVSWLCFNNFAYANAFRAILWPCSLLVLIFRRFVSPVATIVIRHTVEFCERF